MDDPFVWDWQWSRAFEDLLAKAEDMGELAAPYLFDGDILRGLGHVNMHPVAQRLVSDILEAKKENLEEYGLLYMHTYISINVDTPLDSLYKNMKRDFLIECVNFLIN